MFYALFNSEKLIGIFDSSESINNMINGMVQNKLCKKNKLTIRTFFENTIYEVNTEDKNDEIENDKNTEIKTDILKLTPEEEEKRNKKKCELEYELNTLKKNQEKIEESKKTFKVDLELYKKFKKIKEENYQFDIPELFIEKYEVFEMIEKDNNLNWEHFYANYKQKNLASSYSAIFDNDDSKTIHIN